jgi:hypothetical protein
MARVIFTYFKEKLAIDLGKAHMIPVTSSGLGGQVRPAKARLLPSNQLPVPSHGWAVAMVGP